MEADPERLAQEPVCQGQGSFGLLTGLADDDEVVLSLNSSFLVPTSAISAKHRPMPENGTTLMPKGS